MDINEKLQINSKQINDIEVIDIYGQLDAHTAPVLEKYIEELIRSEKYQLVVNFKNLEYISSAGLGVFMAFVEEVRSKNGDIKLTEMQPKIYKIFDLLGFPLLFDITESESVSISNFSNSTMNGDNE